MQKKNILVYYQNPSRSIFFESFVKALVSKGHTVHFLTKAVEGPLHKRVEKFGARIDSHNPKGSSPMRFFSHWRYLVRYCRRNKIDIVYSHLQLANLIALLAKPFIRAKVLPCRHHADAVMLDGNRNAIRIDKWVNRLARKIIVVSDAAKQHMIRKEGVEEKKVIVIPLGYDFSLYDKPNAETVERIKNELKSDFRVIIISRMTQGKRHILALRALARLVDEGLDIKMILVDTGPEEQRLKDFIRENGLGDRVKFTGFVTNTMDYIAASDMLVHPSVSEASNQVVREAGLRGKPCIVCRDVGDFNEYITDRETGFLVSKENPEQEIFSIIKEFYHRKDELSNIGKRHCERIIKLFAIEGIVDRYLEIV